MNGLQSIENVFEIARKNKKLVATNQRITQALQQLVEATASAQTLTDDQKTALDKAIVALQSNS
jgi:hypothetical protein